ncbi:MAG: family 43 glycosylhydrolase [Clostridia bacterium]|nr:family 43 glycosylhydrolase [Clostridia bacterium]
MIPAPLFRDPIYDGAADPMVIRKESDGLFYMFYTQRRANQPVAGVSYCYGSRIGVAESENGRDWHYRGALDLEFEFGQNTFWAPEIVYCRADGRYHMFVSYIRGIYFDWGGDARIEHFVSEDLFRWTRAGSLAFGSARIIDPCLFELPGGGWRMWYKDERQDSFTCYADSQDLYEWEYRGRAAEDQAEEGPNVFSFGGTCWMIADVWDGLAVYRSDDCEHFVRQKENILRESGTRCDDQGRGAHADVFVTGGRAFVVYFTHPENTPRSAVQMAELKIEDGKLICDRNAEFDADWRAE